jgi:hypothetical protein
MIHRIITVFAEKIDKLRNTSFSFSKAFLSPLLILLFLTSYAQDVSIEDMYLQGGDVVIEYSLLDDRLENKYTLQLYSSRDNFIQPLQSVEGDIGVDITVGGNKKIIWHAKEELGSSFKDYVSLELKGKLYIPFITLEAFEEIEKIKREAPANVTWQAGRGSNVLRWDLYNKNDELVYTFTNVANVGNYELVVPKEVKPGKGYYFKISDQDNSEDVIYTPSFMIKRKIPLALQVGVAGVALAAIYIIIDSTSGGSGGENPGEFQFDDPVLPE